MTATIAPVSVQNLAAVAYAAARAPVAPVVAVAQEQIQRSAAPKASMVAMAPAAMTALIEAQEHMSGDMTAADRNLTAGKIDHLLSRLTETPPARPANTSAAPGFSVQMLMAARQQLDTFA